MTLLPKKEKNVSLKDCAIFSGVFILLCTTFYILKYVRGIIFKTQNNLNKEDSTTKKKNSNKNNNVKNINNESNNLESIDSNNSNNSDDNVESNTVKRKLVIKKDELKMDNKFNFNK